MKKVFSFIFGVISILVPWISLFFSFSNGAHTPLFIVITACIFALATLTMAVPEYLKNKSDIIYLTASILGVMGLFYTLPIVYLIRRFT